MPAAPCTSGSTTTAAISSPCAASTRSSAAGVARRARDGVEQQRPVERVEQVDAADRHRADRVAVVGVLEAHEARARGPRVGGLLPVLERHLERDLDRRRAAVGVEDAASSAGRRRASHQAPGQLLGAAGATSPSIVVCATRSSCSRTAASMPRMAVAVDVAPQRRDAVDVAAALGVRRARRPRPARSTGALLGLEAPHLRERMPDGGCEAAASASAAMVASPQVGTGLR